MTKTLLLALMLVPPIALAQAPAQQDQATPAPQAPAQAQQMAQMQSKMKEMQALMTQLHATTDPKERERLMDAHMKAMGEAMGMMDKMAGGMMGPGGGAGMRQCAAGDATCRMDQMQNQQGMMGQRMDMMQMMMRQMMGQMAEQEGADAGAQPEGDHDTHHPQ